MSSEARVILWREEGMGLMEVTAQVLPRGWYVSSPW